MKKLPLGIQTFSKLIEGDYLYIDKTKDIFKLITEGRQYYFISRPRRFGKSLLVSTLKELFLGNKELFKETWIFDKIEWENHPVIHIDFSILSYSTPELFELSLEKILYKIGLNYQVAINTDSKYKDALVELIEKLSKINKVVILIDEYDKPIIDHIEDKATAIKNRDILRQFFEAIKACDEYNKFVFITGVSKFTKVSVFSGLNNISDITLSDDFPTLMGYTEEELKYYFNEAIESFGKSKRIDRDILLQTIKKFYNGYSWNGLDFVYNPYSILNFFKESRFNNYWFTSGTQTFLIKQIKLHHTPPENMENYKVGSSLFESHDIENISVMALLFQTGYLTIKKIVETSLTSRDFYLSYPNSEVKESFLKHLVSSFTGKTTDESDILAKGLTEKLQKNDLEGFFEIVNSLFASIPYNIFISERERYYHTIIYLIFSLMGVNINAEIQTNKGRIDAVVETNSHFYIMEFKLGKAGEAINQIKDKKYYEKYKTMGKNVTLVGVGFDKGKRNIGDYLIETEQNLS